MSNNENNYSDSTNNTNKLLQQNDKGSLEENFNYINISNIE